jgi:gluconolactonase
MSFRTSEFTEIASGLGYPESPVPLSDGGFLVVDIKAGSLLRYRLGSDGKYLADPPIDLRDPSGKLGSGPNGAAIGPDGCVYVCNDGGKQFLELPVTRESDGVKWILSVTGDAASDYAGGYIQRVHLDTGEVEMWCAPDSVGDPVPNCSKEKYSKMDLSSPDDIIFDSSGGFWFTDWGNSKGRSREITGIYYVAAGSRTPIEVIPFRSAPNGIVISPDGKRLYVAETYSRWVVYWKLGGPGKIKCNRRTLDGAYILNASLEGGGILDSMRLDEEGNLYVATMLPNGLDPFKPGGITVISPDGKVLDYIELSIGIPEPLPSNLCFGGPDRKTAFITCAGTGRILICRMKVPGLPAAYGI